MDYKDISERIALLTQEIRDLQDMNEQYSKLSEGNQRLVALPTNYESFACDK